MKQKQTRNQGFTIVELLIATAVFALVLMVFLTALIRVSQIFYKGINISNTQEAARSIVQTISDDIQFTHVPVSFDTVANNYFCIGDHRYTFSKGVQVGSGHTTSGIPDDYGIVRETVGVCKNPFLTVANGGQPVDTAKAEKLLDPGMQLNKITLAALNNNSGLTSGANVKILVVYYGSDNKVFYSQSSTAAQNDQNSASYTAYQAEDARCTGPPNGSQFCATADYQTTLLNY